MSLQNIEQDDVLEGETIQVKKEGKASTSEVEKQMHSSQDSDTPVEENEDAMLPEDGVLLTYVLKTNRREWEGDKESVNVKDKAHCSDSMVITSTIAKMSATETRTCQRTINSVKCRMTL